MANRLTGESVRVGFDPRETGWPTQRDVVSAVEWKAEIAVIRATHERLVRAVRSCDPNRLDWPLGERSKRPANDYIHGVGEDTLYHTGQIKTLKLLRKNGCREERSVSVRVGIEAIKIILMVEEMGRAIAFYRDAIGLEVIQESAMWSELAWGDAVVALHAGGPVVETRETGLSIQVSDLETACRRAERGAPLSCIRSSSGRARGFGSRPCKIRRETASHS